MDRPNTAKNDRLIHSKHAEQNPLNTPEMLAAMRGEKKKRKAKPKSDK